MKIGKINWLLIAIIALGLAIRVWGLSFGLPYMYHPDEGVPVVGALKMLHTGDLNPHFFHWSSLLFYLNALAYGAFFVHQEIATATGELSEGIYTDHLTMITRRIAAPPAPGLYQIELDVDAAGQGRVPVLAFDNKALSDKYFPSPVKFPPAPLAADELSRARPVNTHLGDSITLLGYTLQSGNLLLYWQSAKKMDKDYTVFIHLLDASGRVSAQVDAAPCRGVYPTSLWEPGEIIRDEHTLFDLLPGKYTLELGLYEYPGLSRLAIADANGNGLGDHLDMEVIIQ